MKRHLRSVFFLTLINSSQGLCWQAGQDPAPARVYPASPPVGECANELVTHLWGLRNGETFGKHLPPSNLPPDKEEERYQLTRLIHVECAQPSTEEEKRALQILPNILRGLDPATKPEDAKKKPFLPLIIQATLFQETDDNFYWKAKDEVQVYRVVPELNEQHDTPDAKGAIIPEYRLVQDGYRASASGETALPMRSQQWRLHPALYGDKKINFIGVSCLIDKDRRPKMGDVKDFMVEYTAGTTALTPENWSNLIGAIGALLGAPPQDTKKTLTDTQLNAIVAKDSLKHAGVDLEPQAVAQAQLYLSMVGETAKTLQSGANAEAPISGVQKLTEDANRAAKATDEVARALAKQPTTEAKSLSAQLQAYVSAIQRNMLVLKHEEPGPGPWACRIAFVPALGAKPPFELDLKMDVKPKEKSAPMRITTEPERPLGGPREATEDWEEDTPQDATGGAKAGNCGGFGLGKDGCSSSHQVISKSKEWWDVGMGLPIPGVMEPQYQAPKDASGQPALVHAARRASAMAMFNLYPFAKWADKNSWIPGVVTGVPVTGKSFWMPFVGVSENVTGWKLLQDKKFPVAVNFNFGWVHLNQQVTISPTKDIPNGIGHKRVWKPMFGVEFPVKNLVSKLGGLGGGGGGAKGGK
jgi:hypothetical protein